MTAWSLFLAARYTEDFAQWYAVQVYPALQIAAAKLSSQWEGSFFEVLLVFTMLLILSSIITSLILLIFNRCNGKKQILIHLRFLLCITAFLVMVYSLTCGVNYQRDGIGKVLKLPQTEASKEDLMKLGLILAEDITALTNDPEWDYSLLVKYDNTYIEKEAVASMKTMGNVESSLAGYYPEPKPFHFSGLLSYLGIEGIFSPITMEANYNREMTPFLIPYAMCHELAHLKGFMKEEDAGFIAYLACVNSKSPVFRYSGIFHALIFTLNALKTEVPMEEFNEIYNRLPQQVKYQLIYIKEKNIATSNAFTSAARTVNDYYLKANAQAGTESYGGIVDLLMAEYADRTSKEDLI